jgi:hypothetical protein
MSSITHDKLNEFNLKKTLKKAEKSLAAADEATTDEEQTAASLTSIANSLLTIAHLMAEHEAGKWRTGYTW